MAQHDLTPGDAARIWQTAVDRLQASTGRALVNANRQAGGGDDVGQAIAAALRGDDGAAAGDGRGGPGRLLGSGRAYAGEPADTGSQYVPDQPQKSAVERARELAAEGYSKEEARAKMRQEGYRF
jgi:hypothetical protein